MQPIESIIEQNASIITEVTETPQVQTVVEETPAVQTIMDGTVAVETVLQETESPIVSIINQPTIQVTSVNGKTGDVSIEPEIQDYKEGKYYKAGSLAISNGKTLQAKQDFTAGPFDPLQWKSVGGGEQSDWNQTNPASEAFIKNKPTIPSKTSQLTKDDVYTKTEVEQKLNAKSELPTATANQFLAKSNSAWVAQNPMEANEATTGTAETPRTISAKNLKSAIITHSPPPKKQIYIDEIPDNPQEGDILIDTGDRNSTAFLDKIYPVGSIYITVSNLHPDTLFGGTWERFANGKTLVGLDPSDNDFNQITKTGGEKKHALTKAELPNISARFQIHGQEHGTEFYNLIGNSAVGGLVDGKFRSGNGQSGARSYNNPGIEFGSNEPHNNLQPYIVTYMWRRIA